MIPQEVFEQSLLKLLSPIRPFLDDASVSEIMINGPDVIFIERAGKLEKTEARFESEQALVSALRNLAQFVGRHVDAHRPILEGRLPDGSRVEAVLPPAGPGGPHVAIRRFFKERLTVDRLIEFGSFHESAARFMEAVVAAKRNVVVAGGTGSGKTSLLNVLSSFIPDGERVVTIEDTRELQLAKEHVVPLEVRHPDAKGRGAVSVRDLFRATLRMRPDRIVVGEIRGGEALDLLQAMTSGHGGCLTTVHATYPHDTISRLETMAMMSDIAMPLYALRVQVASAIDLVVQTSRLRDGSRCVTHISEIAGFSESEGYLIRDVYARRPDVSGKHKGGMTELLPTGHIPSYIDELRATGVALPSEMGATHLA